MIKELRPVVDVDKDKCVNCHKCIAACTVKFCNDGSGDHVKINHNMCIGCGHCIQACTHDARYRIDDFPWFLKDLKSGHNIVAIAAPALASNFPGNFKHLIGFLKSMGVQAFFDVSFGAELTVKSYVEHIKTNKPKTVIAQPCPAIVSYCEIYKPQLLSYLAPADSPMMHSMKMIKEYYPQYRDHKILILSPCLAKRREFDEVGIGDYNVTYKSIEKYINDYNIRLSDYPEGNFDDPPAERAVLFSSPGGLMRTAEREVPGIEQVTRKIEGEEIIYHYLDKLPEMIQSGYAPLLVDCLNCEMGCNGGPGTLNQNKSPDEIEFYIEQRNQEMQKKYQKKGLFAKSRTKSALKNVIQKYWKPGLYDRYYVNLSENYTIKEPDDTQLKLVYESMHKYGEEDYYNCNSCGYGECHEMAVAIFNGLNKPENCHYYMESLIKEEQDKAIKTATIATENQEKIKEMHENTILHASAIAKTLNDIRESIAKVASMSNNFQDIITLQDKDFKKMVNDIVSFLNITKKIVPIVDSITEISDRTNILSINTSIEAARAGEIGKRFEIVADEVRNLAKNTSEQANMIRPYAEESKKFFEVIINKLKESLKDFEKVSQFTFNINDITNEISEAITELHNEVKTLVNGSN